MPFRTPPEMGLRIGFGPGLGGGSESRFTIGTDWLLLTASVFTSTGAEVSLGAEVEADGNSGAIVVFLLSRLLLADLVSTGLLTGLAAGGATGGGVDVAPGVTIRTMFSSR